MCERCGSNSVCCWATLTLEGLTKDDVALVEVSPEGVSVVCCWGTSQIETLP
jgi:hypothetical protein